MEALSKNKIKWISSLRLKKNRESEGVFVVEGTKMVEEILKLWSHELVCVCTTDKELAVQEGHFYVSETDMKKISSLKTAPSLLCVVKTPKISIDNHTGLTLIIDGIQDPGNFGTIIRTADWFGVKHIVCSKNTVDVFNPKVVQSSMGSLFRIKVDYLDLTEFISKQKKPIYGALLDGKNVYSNELNSDSYLVIGNEGNGISNDVRALITDPILIPKIGGAESLNASMATGILLAEFSRNSFV